MATCSHYSSAQLRMAPIPCGLCGGWIDHDGTVMDRATTIARHPIMDAIIAVDPRPPDGGQARGTSTSAGTSGPVSPASRPIDSVAARTRKHLQQALGPGEEVRAVVKGHSKQALAVLDDRLIIVKPGFQAGAGFGAKVSAFPYRQIQGINLRTAMLSAGIEILSSAYPRSVTEVGDGKKVRKALYEQPNCLPLTSADAHVQEVVRQISGRAGR